MSAVRLRRLQSDFERLTELARRHPRIAIVQATGSPPDRYQLRLTVRSARLKGEAVEFATDHLIEVSLPVSYPRLPPHCRMLTPVFHPNIAPHAICIGDHWSPGETLSSIVTRIAEMLAYQSYNIKSPLNGEAARWAESNLAQLPLDRANMRVDELEGPPGAAMPAAAPATPPSTQSAPPARVEAAPRPAPPTPPPPPPLAVDGTPVEIGCPVCGVRLRIPGGFGATRVRCPKCRTVCDVPSQRPT